MPSLSAHVGAREARASGRRFVADAAAAARVAGSAKTTTTPPASDATSAAPARLPPARSADRALVGRRASARRRASAGAGASTLAAIRETSPRSHPASPPTPARVYRQPDGTLAPRRPPREPHVVAARKEWADLVHHARTHGGDENATAGRCYRHGVGVLHAEHREYLRSIGLEPETNADGSWVGDDPNAVDPMDHPAHPFNALARRRGVE